MMDELTDYFFNKNQNTFIKPKFPSVRWGKVYTKESTTDIQLINSCLKSLKEKGFLVRKRISNKTKRGTFYQIDIKGDLI